MEYRLPRDRIIHDTTPETTNSHYERENVQAAMLVLSRLLPSIEQATFSVCERFLKQHNESGIGRNWSTTLAALSFPIFLTDHKKILKKISDIEIQFKDREFAFLQDTSYLLSALGSKRSNQILDTFRIKKPSTLHQKLDKGWATMLREFGIFTALGAELEDALDDKIHRNVTSEVIVNKWTKTINEIPFSATSRKNIKPGIIYCPAQSQISNHIGLHFLLNASLANHGELSTTTRVRLLSGSRYVKSQDMCDQYDLLMSRKPRS